MNLNNRNCHHCHECGAELEYCLDGEEWCPVCQQYRHYKSHGWGWQGDGGWECPPLLAVAYSPLQEEPHVTNQAIRL